MPNTSREDPDLSVVDDSIGDRGPVRGAAAACNQEGGRGVGGTLHKLDQLTPLQPVLDVQYALQYQVKYIFKLVKAYLRFSEIGAARLLHDMDLLEYWLVMHWNNTGRS